MEIYSEPGTKVKVTEKTKNNGYDFDRELVSQHLELNQDYTVDYVYVEDFSSTVYLLEIPNIGFSTVFFE